MRMPDLALALPLQCVATCGASAQNITAAGRPQEFRPSLITPGRR